MIAEGTRLRATKGWQALGACATEVVIGGVTVPNAVVRRVFFPDEHRSILSDIRLAKLICRDCPVRHDCLEHAMAKEKHGIWGGRTALERQRERRRRATAAHKWAS